MLQFVNFIMFLYTSNNHKASNGFSCQDQCEFTYIHQSELFLHIYVTVIGNVMTFLHQNNRCIGSQGPLGPGYGSVNTTVCRLQAGKATTGDTSPIMVAQNMMSYRTSRRWHMRSYITAYVIGWRYKSGFTPVLGSLFVSPVAGELKCLISQQSHHELSPGPTGHPCTF